MSKNLLRLDIASNPDLAAAFSNKAPGDECELTVTFVITDRTADSVQGSISAVEVEYGEDEEEAPAPIKPTSEEPVMLSLYSES